MSLFNGKWYEAIILGITSARAMRMIIIIITVILE